ncbi:MAG: hypothetical protein WBL31_14470, partial [Ilumatobacteraceae bacterium]
MAAAAALVVSGCSDPDDAGVAADATIAPIPASTAPSTDPPPPDTSSTAPPTTVPADPVSLREGMTLTAGWTYLAEGFDIPLTYTIPADGSDGRWRVFQANTWSTV